MIWLSRLAHVALACNLMLSLATGCSSSSDTADGGLEVDMGHDLAGVIEPTLFSVTASTASQKGGTQVTIAGTGFLPGATVKFAGIPATSVQFQNNVQLLATVPAYSGPLGPVSVTVQNVDGGMVSRSDLFSYARVAISFAATVTRTAGGKPAAMVAADINTDGRPDLLVANQQDGTLTVLLSNQNLMSVGNPYPTAVGPSALAVADIDGDNRQDVIVACNNANNQDLDVLTGNANGSFNPPTHFAVGMTGTGVVASDFNGDGKVDIAVSIRSQGKVYTLLNTRTVQGLSLGAPIGYAVGNQPVALLLADLNNDGHGDLISANSSDNQVGVLVESGGAFLTPAKVATVGSSPIALASAELTGDAYLDVVAANFNNQTVSLLKGQGDGTFASVSTIQTTTNPSAVALADIDLDGKPDIVVANSGRNQIWILPNHGDGTFDPPQAFVVGQQPWALVATDLNGDGKPDIATANLASGDVSILYSTTTP